MYEYASVISVENNDTINVSCDTSACQGCKAGAFCQTKGKSFKAANSNQLPIDIGDMVEIYLPPGKTVFAAFMALLVPLLLFPVGYYLGEALAPSSSEIVKVLFGVLGMALGFLISRIFSHFKAKDYTPQITRVIDPKEF
ncbi:MAG: SoxR reducing system RseC family protein [Sphaerochaetaceae bacterium]|nr:SoxR reducing system RseC family protein [Candidatus Cloacimonadota bacterium]